MNTVVILFSGHLKEPTAMYFPENNVPVIQDNPQTTA